MSFYDKNILIVDDIKTNLLYVDAILDTEGYTSVYTAISATKAYEILEKVDIDIILLDVQMPDIDGLEACKKIKEDHKYYHIPIIMMTADESDDVIETCFSAGASDFLTKPIHSINLKVRVDKALNALDKDLIILKQNRLLAVNDTVQMLAHQWRQPLSAISTSLLSLSVANQLEKLTPQHLNDSIEKINRYIMNLSDTLNEFKQITKIETEASLQNINDTVQKSLLIIKERIEGGKISIRTNFKEQKDMIYFSNELIKVLINIFTNSIEAFSKQSDNQDKSIYISTEQTPEYTYITIVDNAGGIDQDFLPTVFEPYTSSKVERNGVGLGLYNTFKILKESMNAEIKISSIDKQTSVTVTLPTVQHNDYFNS